MILTSNKVIENRKTQLISMIAQVNNKDVLDAIESLLLNSKTDWWTTLSKSEQFAIDEGLDDIENGRVLSHNDVVNEINNRFKDL
ncbi:MAG: hypothetical protein KIT33_03890 [Candidatus Kapabacteria bacterium]|nr:hypothetical protein [Ignavibacteriota bacterium]MCW5884095.1 hypothetical protein [Candidatus Kapabacteria bacterium]